MDTGLSEYLHNASMHYLDPMIYDYLGILENNFINQNIDR